MTDFAKYQALGNDYVLIDPRDVPFRPEPDAVRLLCDRHFGIGADGLLIGPAGPPRPGWPVDLDIYNADGTPCGRSGNGIRMFALHLNERDPNWRNGTVRTGAGDCSVRVLDVDAGIASVGMGRADFAAAAVPMLGVAGEAVECPLRVNGQTLTVTALHLGNPHAIVFTEAATRALACELGPAIAGHERFPDRVNVQFVQVAGRRELVVEIWERGAGYALGSGSSACAAAAVAHHLGRVDPRVTVHMPGGSLEVDVDRGGDLTMTGAVEKVMTGRFSPRLAARLAELGSLEAVTSAQR